MHAGVVLLAGLLAAVPPSGGEAHPALPGEGGGALAEPPLIDAADLGRDYQVGHQGWNGLSELAALAGGLGCPVEARGALEWDALGGRDVLFFVYPETAPAPEALLGFLAAGGRMVLADDFG